MDGIEFVNEFLTQDTRLCVSAGHEASRDFGVQFRRNTILIYGIRAGKLKPCPTAEKSRWRFLRICSAKRSNPQVKELPPPSAEVLNFLPLRQRTRNYASFVERSSFRSSLKNFGRTSDSRGYEFANRTPVRPRRRRCQYSGPDIV